MNQNEIIIAYLKAQIIIEQERARALRAYPYNTDFNLQAKICDRIIEELGVKIIAIS